MKRFFPMVYRGRSGRREHERAADAAVVLMAGGSVGVICPTPEAGERFRGAVATHLPEGQRIELLARLKPYPTSGTNGSEVRTGSADALERATGEFWMNEAIEP